MRALLILVLFSLVACGATENSDSTASPTSTDSITVSDGAASPAPNSPTPDDSAAPRVESVDCGALSVSGTPPRASDAKALRAASACFLKAVNTCQDATLTIRERDSGVVRQFTVESNAKCIIREAFQPDPNSPPAVVDCKSVIAQNDGIKISSCSHLGDFTITP
ncbi:MAG TPA: hypothetical protein VFD70_13735 [Anaerolineae bacterium]|nr:hypothetical protein [Anaerolineae bacterium]